jgi:hypothetical protein
MSPGGHALRIFVKTPAIYTMNVCFAAQNSGTLVTPETRASRITSTVDQSHQKGGRVMRVFGAIVVVAGVTVAASGGAFAQQTPPTLVAKCTNPNALGVTRTVEIDTTGGPGFGFEHFRQHDFF